MKVLYPLTLSLPGQKYNNEIISLAIMGQAALALSGQSQYIQTTPEMYRNYCQLTGKQFWPRILEIIADGGEILELETYILASASLLNTVVPAGIRLSGAGPGQTPKQWSQWNDGAGQNPIFTLPDGRVILRTNLGGTVLTYQELALLATVPGVTLLADFQLSDLISQNNPTN
jgi:hypothetical protein